MLRCLPKETEDLDNPKFKSPRNGTNNEGSIVKKSEDYIVTRRNTSTY